MLAPLLTSITYFHRWDEVGLDKGKDDMAKIERQLGAVSDSVVEIKELLRGAADALVAMKASE